MDVQQIINGLATQLAETTAEREEARQRLAAMTAKVAALEASAATRSARSAKRATAEK